MRIDLRDLELFSKNAAWPVFEWLRANDPVYWHDESDGSGFWVLTKYDDIVKTYRNPQVFSSRYGMRLDSNPDAVASVSQRMLTVSDPPRHARLKRVFAKNFSPAEMPKLKSGIKYSVKAVVQQMLEAGTVDFTEIAKLVPNYTVCALLGIPRSDWEWIGEISTAAFDSDESGARSSAHAQIFAYFADLLEQRQREPGDDLISRVVNERIEGDDDGDYLTDEEVIFNCNGILSGANETTRHSASGGILALIENPDQWELLRRLGRSGVAGAVEEILRWTTPGVHTLRTAMQSCEIGSTEIGQGDRVTLWNASANRDGDVFIDPDQFRIDRPVNPHITFGYGPHFCIGSKLARLELTAFYEELLVHVGTIELMGVPVYTPSNHTWGLRSLPVRITSL